MVRHLRSSCSARSQIDIVRRSGSPKNAPQHGSGRMRSVIAVTLDGLRSTRCSSAIECTVTVMLDNDPTFVGEGDIDATREIVEKVENAELFLYLGDQHYFAD